MADYKSLNYNPEDMGLNCPKQQLTEEDGYLYPYLVDKWARSRMEDPIEFDWNRVCRVEKIDIDEKWDETPIAQSAKRNGYKYMMVICRCPNPKHDVMKHLMRIPPTDFDEHCPQCISEEMYRISCLRGEREEKNEKLKREKER